ncbi:hypothetical protein [Leifsonia aquatica]|uniref:hypothetical protein n=1 Tax=Leifsonia aquatica TaxID=144185 RepID=UPI00046A1BB8|nr:hypothetical protein [Leifsonia aquatica]
MTAPILSTKGTPITSRDALAQSAERARRRLAAHSHAPAGVLWDRLADRTDLDRKHAKSVVLSPAYHLGIARAFNRVSRHAALRGTPGATIGKILRPYGEDARAISQLIPQAYRAPRPLEARA